MFGREYDRRGPSFPKLTPIFGIGKKGEAPCLRLPKGRHPFYKLALIPTHQTPSRQVDDLSQSATH